MSAPKLPPVTGDITTWARRLSETLQRYFIRNPATKIEFNTLDTIEPSEAGLSWNITDNTLNIGHADGVVQQVGLEHYLRVKNTTGSLISNGETVCFSGASGDIEVQKYIANATIPPYYFIGVATQDLSNNETGMISVFGKVRGINTSSYTVGDILYASPTVAGGLTTTRPTAPNDVVVVAAVTTVDTTNGEILVRPTAPIGLDYGVFTDTTDQTPAVINTAYAVSFNTTDISHNVSVVSGSQLTVSSAGLYAIDIKVQATSSNASSSTVYLWLRKNGVDVANTRLDITIKANGDTKPINTHYQILLAASDYVQIMWASDTTSMTLNASAATAFAPASPSARVTMAQVQL